MTPKIIEKHSEGSVDVLGIVRRIIRHLPAETLDGLQEILIMDTNPDRNAFGCYRKSNGRIELYLDGITHWQPWLLKKTYIFPYLIIGMALGHEIDHHVNRDKVNINLEASAENNALRYVYPSLGLFKPAFRLFSLIARSKVNKSLKLDAAKHRRAP